MTADPFPKVRPRLGRIDKSALTIGEPARIRCREHLDWVKTLPCAVCGKPAQDPHHLTIAQPKARGLTAGDDKAVPLCRTHHDALHADGVEARWWRSWNIDPIALAARVWAAGQLKRGGSP